MTSNFPSAWMIFVPWPGYRFILKFCCQHELGRPFPERPGPHSTCKYVVSTASFHRFREEESFLHKWLHTMLNMRGKKTSLKTSSSSTWMKLLCISIFCRENEWCQGAQDYSFMYNGKWETPTDNYSCCLCCHNVQQPMESVLSTLTCPKAGLYVSKRKPGWKRPWCFHG